MTSKDFQKLDRQTQKQLFEEARKRATKKATS